MSRYFFHLQNGHFTEDREGRDCATLESAHAAAIAEARVMASTSVGQGELNLSHSIAVTDAAGHLVLRVTFGDAVRVQS